MKTNKETAKAILEKVGWSRPTDQRRKVTLTLTPQEAIWLRCELYKFVTLRTISSDNLIWSMKQVGFTEKQIKEHLEDV
jgi:hypothetical protein